jgi:hypothetical protein
MPADYRAIDRIVWQYQLDREGRLAARRFYRKARAKLDVPGYGPRPLFDRVTARSRTAWYVCGIVDTLRRTTTVNSGPTC